MDTLDTKVLFVDGEVSVLESIKRMLLDESKSAHFASNYDEALKIVNELEIDTMIVDITSDNLVELLDKVQETKPNIVKVVISDFSHLSKIINSIRKLNLHSFLLKPWKKNELFETLKSAEDYSTYLKTQEKEKENLEQKNVIYQRIINFKDDVGTYNKVDINSLKTALFTQASEYEKLLNNNNVDKELALKSLSSAIDMYSMTFPTFIEKFSVDELISCLTIENTSVSCKNVDVTYIKNFVLIKELINRLNKFLINFYDVDKIDINIYPEDKLCVRFDFKFNTQKMACLDLFFNFLNKLLVTLEAGLDFNLSGEYSNVTLMF